MRRDPRSLGYSCTRWTLARLRQACPWLHLNTDGGICRLLRRCQISWQRARGYVHSPDRDYSAKLANVQAVRMLATLAPEAVALVYLDEVTVERQPTCVQAYASRGGSDQPRAHWGYSHNTLTRLIATLDHCTGQVVTRRASKITLAVLVQFFQDLRAAYPQVERIYMVMDNWPIHIHPDVLVALEPQESRWFRPLPPSWSSMPSAKALRRWSQLRLPIQLVPLPTYASWCNPIEKLWRKLRQEVTHLHRWADDLIGLRGAIDAFMAQFATRSTELLQYVGLGTTRLIC